MNFENENNAEERRKTDAAGSRPSAGAAAPRANRPKSAKGKNNSPEVGRALRSIYQHTIDEDIPPEMLDLLGKLG